MLAAGGWRRLSVAGAALRSNILFSRSVFAPPGNSFGASGQKAFNNAESVGDICTLADRRATCRGGLRSFLQIPIRQKVTFTDCYDAEEVQLYFSTPRARFRARICSVKDGKGVVVQTGAQEKGYLSSRRKFWQTSMKTSSARVEKLGVTNNHRCRRCLFYKTSRALEHLRKWYLLDLQMRRFWGLPFTAAVQNINHLWGVACTGGDVFTLRAPM